MRKLRADWIFDGRRLHSHAILVIEEDGTVMDLLLSGRDAAAESTAIIESGDTEYFQGILCPGFINAHCHLELSHLKGLVPRDGGLVDFVLDLQRKRHFPKEAITDAMEKAEDEMRFEGIAGVGDIANSGISFFLKSRSALRYHTFIEVFGFDPGRAEEILSKARELQEKGAGSRDNPNTCTIVPHSPYSVSEKLFRMIAENGQKPALLSIHNQESPHEDLFYREGTGDIARLYREFDIDISFYRPYLANALPTWLSWLKAQKKLLVHNTYTTAEDLDIAAEQGLTSYCLCPNANLYIENRLPDIPMFIEKGCNLLLGTDSLASNDRLSILEEMKTISRYFPEIELEQLLQWATLNGAEFFGWKELGSFQKGKKPGANLLRGLKGLALTNQSNVQRLL